MNATERSMRFGLRGLNQLAGGTLLDRVGLRKPAERWVYRGSRGGFRSAAAASRTFKAARRLASPARQGPTRGGELFDLTPDEEQQMLREAVGAFAQEKVRPAASDADSRVCNTDGPPGRSE